MILGAGLMQKSAIEATKALGYDAVVVDANPRALCVPFADRFERIDLKDAEGIARFALSLGDELRAVFTSATDFSAAVSLAAVRCGFADRVHTPEAARRASDKLLMRQCFKESGVPSPEYFAADEEFVRRLEHCASGVSFPKVVKPCDNMGARGCRLVRNDDELVRALKEALAYSRSKRAIVEDYMEGPEFSIDALVVEGRVIVTGLADRHIYFAPHFVELGHTMPSSLAPEKKAEVVRVFCAGVRALGLTNGAAKGDVKLTGHGAMIGEIAARLSGGYMSGWTFPYAAGFDLTQEALKIALGCPSRFDGITEVKPSKVSAERAFISLPGVVAKVYGANQAQACPFVKDVFFRVGEGDEVAFPRNNVEKCGNVISLSEDHTLAVKAAEDAASKIVLRLSPCCDDTDEFLRGDGCDTESGLYSFYDVDTDDDTLQGQVERLPAIGAGKPVMGLVPAALKDVLDQTRDWNHRSLEDSLELFDELCPDHSELDAKRFWRYLIRGGIQGVLYYADSLECGHEI